MKGATLEEIRQKAPPPEDRLDTRGSSKLGKNEFLKLLMTQLQNQDPLAPTDSGAFVAQLAQFSALEMQQNSNSTLEKLLISQAAAQQVGAVNMVGKEVLYRTDNVNLEESGSVNLQADISRDAANVTVVIEDEAGTAVRTIQVGARTAGLNDVAWDGRNDRGDRLPMGAYKARVTASDTSGANVDVVQRAGGRVTGVSYETGVPQLMLGDVRINLSDVSEIKERKNTP